MMGGCAYTMRITITHFLKALGIALVFILAGILSHLPWQNEFLQTFCKLTGNVLMLALLIEWLVRIYSGVIQKAIRKYLLATALLTIYWYVIKIIKWYFVDNETVARYFWYSYYIAIVLLPLFALFTAICVAKSDNYALPQPLKLLFVPAVLLILLVLTNDWHQTVFAFRPDFVNCESEYSYQLVYYLIFIWDVLLALPALAILYKHCKIPNSKRRILLPFLFVVLAILYCIGYLFLSGTFFYRCMDLTTVFCALVYGIWNSCADTGLIHTNSKYADLFKLSNIDTLITDQDCHIVYASQNVKEIDRDSLLQAKDESITRSGHKRLRSTKIRNGYIYWIEDIREIHSLLEQLQEDKELLHGKEALLKADIEVKKKTAAVEKKLELYSKIYDGITPQFSSIDTLLREITPQNVELSLKKICFLSAYIKRRSNLLLLLEENKTLKLRELSLCLKETLNYTSLFQVEYRLNVEDDGYAGVTSLIAAYDWFENCIEPLIDHLSVLYVKLSQDEEAILLNLLAQTDDEVKTYHSTFFKGGEAS